MKILRSASFLGSIIVLANVNADDSMHFARFPGQKVELKQANFIVIQPDDHYFFQEWNPPGQFDGASSLKRFPPNANGLPNINRLRLEGLQMENAYAASTMCGTSRYSTITGRYPSRSSYGRAIDEYSPRRDVRIPATKLEDVEGVSDSKDCTENNIAALLKENGYRTGVVGKWHLTSDDGGSYSYGKIRDDIKSCGFDFAEAIYKENLWGDWYGDVTHNMEHVTSEAIQFIESSVVAHDKPFFLYFNPTVPHNSADVTDALRFADCRQTLEGNLDQPPPIPYGMTANFGGDCRSYRNSVLQRGGTSDDKMAGAVWVDDAVGSLLQTLESLNVLDNTFVLFQLDHGEAAKGTLYEPGSRVVQFIHYPDRIPGGFSFRGLVSTIDIAPTIAQIAGISPDLHYPMDGKSWMSEISIRNNDWSEGNDRCLFVEEGLDRSVRCGCYKYISINDVRDGRTVRGAGEIGLTIRNDNFYDLCDVDNGLYVRAPDRSPERRFANFDSSVQNELMEKIRCHLGRTNPSNNPNYDADCDKALGELKDAQPTPFPMSRPTLRPTHVPTLQPTPRPTLGPTNIPTLQPTLMATSRPTLSPSSPNTTSKPSSSFSAYPSQPPTSIVSIEIESNITDVDSLNDVSNSTDIVESDHCFDDEDYLYLGQEGKDCFWVIQNDRCDREDSTTNLHVGFYHCPESCSFCFNDGDCVDNQDFLWFGETGNDCSWLQENDRCERVRKGPHNSTLHVGKHYCPETCGFCSGQETVIVATTGK